jgi:hypothetical protein
MHEQVGEQLTGLLIELLTEKLDQLMYGGWQQEHEKHDQLMYNGRQ